MEILRVENIVKSFGKVEVLKGIDFSLEEGQDATEGTAWVEFEIKDKSKLKSY